MENKLNISAVITVYNKESTVRASFDSLLKQAIDFREIIIVDDNSSDGSAEIIKKISTSCPNARIILKAKREGISSALNTAITAAKGDYILVLDGDAVLGDGWIEKVIPFLKDEKVAAVSGITKLANCKNLWSALAGYNVEFRQSKIKNLYVDHLSTCNTIYRKRIFEKVGLFDTGLYYGQDNELSYRLVAAGFKLILIKDAWCVHFWPEGLNGFFRQRFNGAIGRLALAKKHSGRWKGDNVSNISYFLELPLALLFILSIPMLFFGKHFLIGPILVMSALYFLMFEEIVFFIKRKKIGLAILLPFFSLIRSFAWLSGICYWRFNRKYF